MKAFFQYLSYVIRHKWYVMVECFKVGLFWQGITHDLSKLLPDEFFPYMRYFYKKNNSVTVPRDSSGYYKPYDTGDKEFDYAWLLHQKRNKHHWQWWILPCDTDGIKILDMPERYIQEMICDWRGAGKAQGFGNNTKEWYAKNGNKMQLSNATRRRVDEILAQKGEK